MNRREALKSIGLGLSLIVSPLPSVETKPVLRLGQNNLTAHKPQVGDTTKSTINVNDGGTITERIDWLVVGVNGKSKVMPLYTLA